MFRKHLRLDTSTNRVVPHLSNTTGSNIRLNLLFPNRTLVLNRGLNVTLGSDRQHLRLIERLSSTLPLPILRFPLNLRTINRFLTRRLRHARDLVMLPRLYPNGISILSTLFFNRLPKYLHRPDHLPSRGHTKAINTPHSRPRRRRGTRSRIRHLRVQRNVTRD